MNPALRMVDVHQTYGEGRLAVQAVKYATHAIQSRKMKTWRICASKRPWIQGQRIALRDTLLGLPMHGWISAQRCHARPKRRRLSHRPRLLSARLLRGGCRCRCRGPAAYMRVFGRCLEPVRCRTTGRRVRTWPWLYIYLPPIEHKQFIWSSVRFQGLCRFTVLHLNF